MVFGARAEMLEYWTCNEWESFIFAGEFKWKYLGSDCKLHVRRNVGKVKKKLGLLHWIST